MGEKHLLLCGSCSSVVNNLDYWTKGYDFKSQHIQAANVGPLHKALNPQMDKKKYEKNVTLDNGVCQIPWMFIPLSPDISW